MAPDRIAIEYALQAAMQQIYGVDEASVHFTVSFVKPSDCWHLSAIYREGAASGPSQNVPVNYGDDGQWYLTLYGKRYPVK